MLRSHLHKDSSGFIKPTSSFRPSPSEIPGTASLLYTCKRNRERERERERERVKERVRERDFIYQVLTSGERSVMRDLM